MPAMARAGRRPLPRSRRRGRRQPGAAPPNRSSFEPGWPQLPAMEAAVNNAMLDLLARSRKIPIYQFLGGPTRFKARVLARLDGADEVSAAGPLERAKRQGFRAFTMPALQRDAMIPLQEYVDRVRARVAKMQAMGGAGARMGARRRRRT